MTEPINGVSLAENYIDIRSERGRGKKKPESPYLSLKTDFTWVFEMERLPTPRAIFSPSAPTTRGSESPDTLTAKSMKQKLLCRCLGTSVWLAALHTPAQPTFVSGGAALPWTTPPSLTLWESVSCQVKRSQVLSFPDNLVRAQHSHREKTILRI